MQRLKLLSSAAVLVAGLTALSVGQASAAAFPNFGVDDNGPSQIITIAADGTASVSNAGGYSFYPHPYDQSDDTYVGVINNSSTPISSLPISCGALTCFGFESDGIDHYGAASNPSDTTGYGGPNAFFTGINGAKTAGTVNFIAAIAGNGGTGYFSLEEPLLASDIVVGTPLPSTWTMMLAALAGLGFLAYRTTKRATPVLAAA